jgi:hypothetical protein
VGRVRYRQPAEVREKAIETAVAKYDAGCEGCAASYLDVARAHGATEEQVARAGMGRRGFLKLAAAIFAAGAAASVADLVIQTRRADAAARVSAPGQGAFGVDSCTPLAIATGALMPCDFYIAEIGAPAYSLDCFDANTAAHVGPNYTHGYWGFAGPAGADDPFAWGRKQALDALAAVSTMPGIGGHTLFADVEFGFGGWNGAEAHPDRNARLLDGFLTTIAAAQYVPGVYINNHDRDAWFGGDYRAPVPFVYWVAGGPHAGRMCAPCDPTCDTLTTVRQLWSDHVSQETFAGQHAALWQYWLSDFGCGGDFVYTPQSGHLAFTPVS